MDYSRMMVDDDRRKQVWDLTDAELWLQTVSFNEFYDEISKEVIGQKNLKLFLAQVYNYIEAISRNRPINHNMILAAPSGSGKTETYRVLRSYFAHHIPQMVIANEDLSQITATGFRGKDANELLREFAKRQSDGFGICFLDEFDKKIMPSYDSGGSDVNTITQGNLLTLVEGKEVQTRHGVTIDTGRIMFVGMGAFDVFREKKKKDVRRDIGFGSIDPAVETYSHLTKKDMLECGGITEFIGRFPVVVNFDKLSREGTRLVIHKFAMNIAKTYACDLDIKEDYIEYLIDTANGPFGCRELDSIIRSDVLAEFGESLCDDEIDKQLTISLISSDKTSHFWKEKISEEDFL